MRGELTINELREGVGLPPVANGGDNRVTVCTPF
jgi:hypothetical protein